MKCSVLGLMYLIQGMRKVGIDVDQKLEKIGLRADALDASAIIHPQLEWDVLNILGVDLTPEQGIEIGQHYTLAGYGPLLMLLVTSPSIGVALAYVIEYQKLTHLTGKLQLKVDQQHVSLCYQPKDLETSLGQLRAHAEISGTHRFLKDIYKMMGLNAPEMLIHMPFSAPKSAAHHALYQQYYGTELIFNAPYASFCLDHAVLSVLIPSADSMTFRVYANKCQAELERLQTAVDIAPLIQRVQDYLELQQGVWPSMAETAQVLQLPERTLRHQLQQLGSSYKHIREQMIKEKALKLMEYQEYSIEMISELLGYSEPAAFNHAFKRWFGQSPRQYLK